MGTNLTYNGIVLTNVLTREFAQEPVRDVSNTDVLHHRFRVVVETIINPTLLAESSPRLGAVIPGFSSGTAAEAVASIHRLLSQDRGAMSYDFDGAVVLDAEAADSGKVNADANNGPRVIMVNLTQISPETIHVMFGVEVAAVICPQTSTHPVLNNRWSSTDDVDENFKATRRWRGRLRLRTAAASPHDYRELVLPPLVKGWRRKSMNFTAEANSLELSYEVTDEELVGQAVPSPATSMECTHRESITVNGAKVEGSLRIRLGGPRTADKKKMLARAWEIALAKLNFKSDTSTNIVQSLELTDHIGPHVNAVELNATVLKTELNADTGAFETSDFGKTYHWTADYSPDQSVVLGPHGTASAVGLFACYLQSPCRSDHSFPSGTGNQSPPNDPKTNEVEPAQKTYTEAPATDQVQPVKYSAFHQQAIYTFLQIESHILRTENRIALPIAKASPAAGDTAAVIRLAPATARRLIKVAAERVGARVQLYRVEDFEVGGFKHRLLNADFNLRPPQVGGDNKKTYSADATYEYSLNRAPAKDESLPVGAFFWDTTVAADNTYTDNDYLAPVGPKGLG